MCVKRITRDQFQRRKFTAPLKKENNSFERDTDKGDIVKVSYLAF